MSGTVIFLTALGLIFIFCSFFVSEKFSADMREEKLAEIPDELSEADKAAIDKLITDYMNEKIDSRLAEIEGKFAEIVNEKTLALGDYAVTVNEEIEKNHSEVMFLYNMLSDKQKELMTTANMVDDVKKDVEEYVSNTKTNTAEKKRDDALEEEIKEIDESLKQAEADENSEEKVEELDSSKDVILEMHKSGLSILEIAKHLGLGVGEVKLVVDLYQGETK